MPSDIRTPQQEFSPSQEYLNARSEAEDRLLHAKQQIAAILEPQIAKEFSQSPQGTYEDKRALASWLNRECKHFGISVKCPKSGRPAVIEPHNSSVAGGTFTYFRFHSTSEDGSPEWKTYARSLSQVSLTVEPQPSGTWSLSKGTRGRTR